MKPVRQGLFLVALSVIFSPPPGAHAQRIAANERALARREFSAGVSAARAHRWQEAREAFARAYALTPRPLVLLNLAGAQAQTGALVEAAESYRLFLREAESGPAERHRDSAQAALATVEQRIAQVRIRIDGLEPGDRIEVDEQAVSRATLGASLPLDPGPHRLAVLRADREVARQSFALEESSTQDVALAIPRTSRRPFPSPTLQAQRESRPERVASSEPQRDSSGSVWGSPWFWTAVGAAVIGSAIAGYVVVSGREADPYQGNFPPGHVSIK